MQAFLRLRKLAVPSGGDVYKRQGRSSADGVIDGRPGSGRAQSDALRSEVGPGDRACGRRGCPEGVGIRGDRRIRQAAFRCQNLQFRVADAKQERPGIGGRTGTARSGSCLLYTSRCV